MDHKLYTLVEETMENGANLLFFFFFFFVFAAFSSCFNFQYQFQGIDDEESPPTKDELPARLE